VKEADRIDFEGKRGKVIIEQSRYKAYHMPIYYIASATVSWFVFGDGQAIDYLLLKVNSIGKKRSQGWGQVLDWRIEPAQEDYSEYRDGNGNGNGDKNKNKPSRTIPIDEENIPGVGNFGYRGYRPPYWHPARQSLVLLPDKDALCWQ
jgi:CRISPR type IV-associated protein Csf3